MVTAKWTYTTATSYARVAECLWRSNASGIYYAFLKSGGKQFHRSLKTTDRALAERRLAAYRQKVGGLKHGKETTALTFGELADRWLETISAQQKPASALRRQISVNQLKKFLGSVGVRSLSAKDCDDWVVKRGKFISASSFNNECETLKRILEFALRDGLILENPALHIKCATTIILFHRRQLEFASWLGKLSGLGHHRFPLGLSLRRNGVFGALATKT